jgi:hypothetical protein
LRQCGGEFAGHWRFYLQALSSDRMVETEFDARQQRALASKVLGEKAVVAPLAVSGVADDRVRDMFQVTAQLVTAPGDRLQFK